MDRNFEFNEILKHVNELSMSINLKSTLEKAESIYLQIKEIKTLPDDIRIIIGQEPLKRIAKEDIDDEYDDNFDDMVTISSRAKDDIEIQKKLEEACERSMYSSFY